MFKPIIVASALILSINSYAGCQKPNVSGEEPNISVHTSVKELRKMKRDLVESRDEVEYTYYYTLTHNRISKKSFEIITQNRIDEMKANSQNNPKRLADINEKESQFKNNLDTSLVRINEKTAEMKKAKYREINQKIDEIDEILRQKAEFPKTWI